MSYAGIYLFECVCFCFLNCGNVKFETVADHENFVGMAGEVIFEEYTLEYGKDRLEMHVGAVEHGERALVVDDLIATGGTLGAAMNLLGNNFLSNFMVNINCFLL